MNSKDKLGHIDESNTSDVEPENTEDSKSKDGEDDADNENIDDDVSDIDDNENNLDDSNKSDIEPKIIESKDGVVEDDADNENIDDDVSEIDESENLNESNKSDVEPEILVDNIEARPENADEYFFDEDLWEFEDAINDVEYEIDNDILFFDDKDIKKELGNLLISNYRSSSLNAKFYSHKLENFFEILRDKPVSSIAPFDNYTFCPNMKIIIKIKKNVFNGAGEREKLNHIFDTKNFEDLNLDTFLSKWTKQNISDTELSPICTELSKCKKLFKYDTDVVYYWNNGEDILEDMRLVSSLDCVEPIGIIFTNTNTNKYEVCDINKYEANNTQYLTQNCIVLFGENKKYSFETQLTKAIPTPDKYLSNSKIEFHNTKALLSHFPSFERVPGIYHSIKQTVESFSKTFKKTINKAKQKNKNIHINSNNQRPNFLKYKSYPFANSFIDDDFGRFHHLLQRNDRGTLELLLDMEKFVKGLKTVKPHTFPSIPIISDQFQHIERSGFIFPCMLDALNDHKYINSDDVAYVCMPDNVILPLRKQMLQNKLIWVIDQKHDIPCIVKTFHIKLHDRKKFPPMQDLLCLAKNFTKDSCIAANLHIQKKNLLSIEGRGGAFVEMIKTSVDKQIKSLHLINVWNYEKTTHHENTYLEESNEVLGDVEYVNDPKTFNSVIEDDENNDENNVFLQRLDDPSTTKLGKNIARIVQSLCVQIPNSQLLQLENFINLQFNDTELHTRKLVELKPILQKIKAMAIQNNMKGPEINKQIQDAQIVIDKKYIAYKSKSNDTSIFIIIAFLIIYIQTKLPTVLVNPSALPAKDEANILGYPLSDQKIGIIPYFASILMYYMKQDLQVFTLTEKYDKEQIVEKIVMYVDLLLKKGAHYKDLLKGAAARILEAKNDEQFRIQKNIAKFGVWDMFRPPITFDENKNITNEAAIFVKSIQLFANKQEVYLFRSDKTKYRINSCCRVPIREADGCLAAFYQSKNISDLLNRLVHKDSDSLMQRPCTFNFKRTQLSKNTTDYEITHKVHNYVSDKFKINSKLFKNGNLHFDEFQNLDGFHEVENSDTNIADLFKTSDENIMKLHNDVGIFSKLLQDMGNHLLKIIEDTDNRMDIDSFRAFIKIVVNIDMNKLRGHVYVNHTSFIQSFIAFFSKIQNDYVFSQGNKEAMLKKMNIIINSLDEYILSSKEMALLKDIKGSREEMNQYLESVLPFYTQTLSQLHAYLLNVDPYKCIILNIYCLFKTFTEMLSQFSNNLKKKLIDILIWMVNDYITRFNLAFSNNDFVREEYEKQREMKKQDSLKKTKNVGDETLGIYRELKKRNMLFDLTILNDNLETNVDIQGESENQIGREGEIEAGAVILENNDAFDMDGNNMPGPGEGDD